MPMRNAEPFVRAALESVLAQDGVELEVVVIDDGSTDRSAEVVRAVGDPRVRLLPGPCRGISAALNTAIEAARGEFVARCDSDDLYPSGRLARHVGWLTDHPEFGAVCGSFSTMTHDGRPVADLDCGGEVAEEITHELRADKIRTSLCTFTLRTDLVRRLGGFRPYFVTGEDIDFQLRLGEVTRVWYDPQSVYRYRLHETSITHTQGNARQAFFEARAKEFAAQRRAGRPDDLERGCPPPLPTTFSGPAVRPGQEIQGLLLAQAWEEHTAGHKLQALRTGVRAWAACPSRLSAWKSLAALVLRRTPRR
jgi:glycosyltransferase involved in cell wall biosynthesis